MSNLREGIKLVLKQIPRDIHKYMDNPNDAPSYDDYINQILSLLKGQNVVRLKDNQELPEDDYPYKMDTFWRYRAFDDGQESMLKANFKAVEELE